MPTARTTAPEPETAPDAAAAASEVEVEKLPTVDDLSPREKELLGVVASPAAAASVASPALPSAAEVYLTHESGNPGSDGWYPAAVADVLLRCGEGWHTGDAPTATPTHSDAGNGDGDSDQKE